MKIIDLILEEIEKLRELMHVTALEKGVLHPDVLEVSRILDEKLNEYLRLKR